MVIGIQRGMFLALTGLAPVSLLASTAFHIEIADTGAYRISHEQLAAASSGLGEIPSGRLALSTRGEPRHLHVHDGGDGHFGPGDTVTFYGERLYGKQGWFDTYAVNNVYRLEIADAPVAQPAPSLLRKAALAPANGGLRRHLHLEEENLQIRLNKRWIQPGEEPDLWHWAKLTQIDPDPFRTSFSLPDLSDKGTVRILIGLRGLSNIRPPKDVTKPDDHVVDVAINGQRLPTARFESRNEHVISVELPADRLQETGNRLELQVPKRTLPGQTDALVDVAMFDFIAFDFPIDGDLDETPLPIALEPRMPAHAPSAENAAALTLVAKGVESLVLYGRDGSRHEGLPRDGHSWQFRLAVAGDYQPVVNGRYSDVARIRLMSTPRWRDVEKGYDYLLISHSTLAAEARPLAEHHREHGLRVAEVDVDDLYDEFNHGIVHPNAIRDFIAHAYHQWPAPRPRFVLLVGDASFDVRSDRAQDNRYAKWVDRELLVPGQFGEIPGGQYQNTDKIAARRNLIPTWQYPSEEGHSAADNYFVAVDGDDWLPDLALGRFPVVEPTEVAAIVAKTIRYVDSTDFGAWRRKALFTTDTSKYFQSESDRLAGTLQSEGFRTQAVYANAEETDNAAQIHSITDALNDGQLLVHFIGHGGRYIWRTGPPDLTRNHDLFTLDHVAQLKNGDRLPMVLSMTCYSAPFDHPSADSIGERFLREADKGAIAVFAASWRNTPTPKFSEAAVTELMTPGATIGEALMRAKRVLTEKWHRTLVETYNLLGDPAVILQRPSLPIELEIADRGTNTVLDLAFPEITVNGRATVEWRDETGALLAQRSRELRGNRGSFVIPPEVLPTAAEAFVHVIDYRSRRDGIALLPMAPSDPDENPAQGTQLSANNAEAGRPVQAQRPRSPAPPLAPGDRINEASMD